MLQKIGDTLHGFAVTRIRESEELGGRIVELTYEKTGTRAVWIDNGLENKTFAIAFKTLPEDSTGVFHILEHSVLCGSAKYPVREPFVELLKSSVNTFLNAMTFTDKTVYPVASRNDTDFLGLTEVYLDAVFAPDILHNPNIFYQEGWHIEQDEEGKLSYKGVVFNEMKGALSSPDGLAEYTLNELLYADTSDRFNSGGDPAVIPQLTYAQFLETYRRFYHPSNAKIFLDGKIPLEETFALLEEYLSQFTRSEDLPQERLQKPVSGSRTLEFDFDRTQPTENETILAAGKIIGTWEERTKMFAVRVLKNYLAGSNEAPLVKALLDKGLVKDFSLSVDDSMLQPALVMLARGVTDGKAEEILPTVREAARKLLAEGLDRAELEAALNRFAFNCLEPTEPSGIDRCLNCLEGFLHDGDPLKYTVFKEDLAAVRAMLDTDAFTKLTEELFLSEEGLCSVTLIPSHTRGDEQRAEEAARLAETSSAWTEADYAANRALNENLLKWQQTPDTPEQLATLPQLPLSAIREDIAWTETEVRQEGSFVRLFHPVASPGIVHTALRFRASDCDPETLFGLQFAATMFGQLPTANRSVQDLQREMRNLFGHFTCLVSVLGPGWQDPADRRCSPSFDVCFSVLEEKLPAALSLVQEILQTTDFSAKDRIRTILKQEAQAIMQVLAEAGHSTAVRTACAHGKSADALQAELTGLPAVRRFRRLSDQFDSDPSIAASFVEYGRKIAEEVCVRARLTASVSSVHDYDISALTDALPEGSDVPKLVDYRTSLPRRIGVEIPAQIGYSAQAGYLPDLGAESGGALLVAAQLLSLSYLWVTVRVQGGAYGTRLLAGKGPQRIVSYSYRDPSPAGALAANAQMSEFIRQFCASEEPLEKFIISTAAGLDPLRTPLAEAEAADLRFLQGITHEDVKTLVREILHTDKAQLLALCDLFDRYAAEGAVCVLGSAEQLAAIEGLEMYSCR